MNLQLITFGVMDNTGEVVQNSWHGYDSIKDAAYCGNESIQNGDAEGYFVVAHHYDESIDDDVTTIVYEEETSGFLLQCYPFVKVRQVSVTVK